MTEQQFPSINILMSYISYGGPTSVDYDTNTAPHEGGWVNVTLPVFLDGKKIGDAFSGAWVWTCYAMDGATADVRDECIRDGWAVRAYRGNERQLQLTIALSDLVDDEDTTEWQIEEAILDGADKVDDTDYGDIFRAELLNAISDETTRDTLKADGTTRDLLKEVAMVAIGEIDFDHPLQRQRD